MTVTTVYKVCVCACAPCMCVYMSVKAACMYMLVVCSHVVDVLCTTIM